MKNLLIFAFFLVAVSVSAVPVTKNPLDLIMYTWKYTWKPEQLIGHFPSSAKPLVPSHSTKPPGLNVLYNPNDPISAKPSELFHITDSPIEAVQNGDQYTLFPHIRAPKKIAAAKGDFTLKPHIDDPFRKTFAPLEQAKKWQTWNPFPYTINPAPFTHNPPVFNPFKITFKPKIDKVVLPKEPNHTKKPHHGQHTSPAPSPATV